MKLIVSLLLVAQVATAFDHNAAAEWAEGCAYGCSECPDDQSCTCTLFTTKALKHGDWGYGQESVCKTLWSNFKAGKYSGWKSVGTDENKVQEGFAVIMNNGHDGDASHCCVGTGKGKVSCHNPGHKDVPPHTTWYSGGYINEIWGWGPDIKATEKQLELESAMNTTEPLLQDTIISCDPYQKDACNCVYYARDRQPKLPGGLSTCDDKKSKINSHTAKPGCVMFRTGDPTYCHATYVTKVQNGNVYYDQANWTPCQCSKDSLPSGSSKIMGYWCP
jgi:hypothetical protein